MTNTEVVARALARRMAEELQGNVPPLCEEEIRGHCYCAALNLVRGLEIGHAFDMTGPLPGEVMIGYRVAAI